MSVEFPPPACALIGDAVVVVVVVVVLLPLVFCALMTLKLMTLKLVVVVISSIIDNAGMIATTANMDFIVVGSWKLII
jgi:hypothetical protein